MVLGKVKGIIFNQVFYRPVGSLDFYGADKVSGGNVIGIEGGHGKRPGLITLGNPVNGVLNHEALNIVVTVFIVGNVSGYQAGQDALVIIEAANVGTAKEGQVLGEGAVNVVFEKIGFGSISPTIKANKSITQVAD